MITMKEWMEICDYKITEGSDFTWQVFGGHAYTLSAWNGSHDGWSFNLVFDTHTQEVYLAEACDYKNNRAYRLINPDYKDQYMTEGRDQAGEYLNQAWDDVDYIDLDVDSDFIQKAKAIAAGENYDTRVQIEVDFSDEDLLQYMKLAHNLDITFNELVERAVKEAIDKHNRDPEGFAKRAREFLHED